MPSFVTCNKAWCLVLLSLLDLGSWTLISGRVRTYVDVSLERARNADPQLLPLLVVGRALVTWNTPRDW